MNKLIVLVGLAVFAVAASALEQEVVTSNPVCPTSLPCCSCKCIPKGCPPVKRPEHCKVVGHCPVCPHKCNETMTMQLEATEEVVAPAAPVCPTSLPCCSCKCIPKGCPPVKRPEHCKVVGHCPVCPHKCNETMTMQLEATEEVVAPAALVCPTTLPCCSCLCVPKGCPPVKRPEHCKHVGHCPVCPHKCNETMTMQLEATEEVVAPAAPVCPTSLPCCSCKCIPKGCPPVKRPEHCKVVGHCPVCPHKCNENMTMQLEATEEVVAPAALVCPTTLPCCSCLCVPKGCPPVKRPEHCKHVGHCPVCPHKCNETMTMLVEQSEEVIAPMAPVCPTTRPCCSCACTPKGCPPAAKPKHCEHIKCKFVCPHKCDE